MGLKAQKVMSIATNGFDETKEFEVLHQSHVGVNHNKFYCLELQFNPSTSEWRLFSHYGRLGKTNVFDIRGPVDNESIARKEFESILRKKKKGKKVKREGETEIEQYVKIDTVMPSVGSDNIRKKSSVTVKKVVDHIDTSAFSDPIVSRVVSQIVDENIHNITSNTTLTLTSNGFETPLGPVTKEHVDRARQPLNNLKLLLSNGKLDPSSKQVEAENNAYYSLIPHDFSHRITRSDWIIDDVKLMNEFDLLNQLETAVSMGSAMKNTKQQINALGTEIKLLEDKKDWGRIVKKIETSKASNHRNLDIWKYKVKNVFKIKIPEERNCFLKNGRSFGNVKELFHGSKNCNILSILKSGLVIPPVNANYVTGRMFGDGLYFANRSTKSLNYSTNFWNRSFKSKFSNVFLFLSDVSLGNYYETYYSQIGLPKGYDSIWAKTGRNLSNDEFIIFNLKQHTLTYLIEMK